MSQHKCKTYKHQTQSFKEIVNQTSTLLKKNKKAYNAGTSCYQGLSSGLSILDFKKIMKKEWTKTNKIFSILSMSSSQHCPFKLCTGHRQWLLNQISAPFSLLNISLSYFPAGKQLPEGTHGVTISVPAEVSKTGSGSLVAWSTLNSFCQKSLDEKLS